MQYESSNEPKKKWWDRVGDRLDDIERHSKRLLIPTLLLAMVVFLAIAAYAVMRFTRVVDGIDYIVNTVKTETLPVFSEQAKAQIETAGETQLILRSDVHEMMQEGKAAFQQINDETIPALTRSGNNAADLLASLNKEVPPTIAAVRVDLNKLGATIDSATDVVNEGKLVIQHADKIVQNAEQYIAEDQAQVLEILKRQVKIHDNLTVISDPESYKALLKEGTGATAELHGILTDTHKVTTYLSNELIPKEKVYSKSPVKRAFQKTGNFLVTVGKNGFVFVKMASLFVK